MLLLYWILYPLVVIALWEYFGMSLDWHGFHPVDIRSWGKAKRDTLPDYIMWSFRIGPLELYRM